jgi:hypothetical protein
VLNVLGGVLAGLPLLAALGLLLLAEWRDRRRAAALAQQIRLTDAIAAELGTVVAPVVSKPLAAPWRVKICVPVARGALVSRVVAIAHHTLGDLGVTRYELVLAPEPVPMRRVERMRLPHPREAVTPTRLSRRQRLRSRAGTTACLATRGPFRRRTNPVPPRSALRAAGIPSG